MAISLIIGKPGSGKSYFAVSKIADFIREWVEYEEREGAAFDRVLYTNLYLNVEAFNAYIKRLLGKELDVSKYIHHLEEDFFYTKVGETRNPKKWWDDIPNKAFIVIDEVHQYMPSQGTGAKDYMQLFVEYVATHRHREQDLYLITQHTDTIHRSILCMAGDVFHVVNVKNKVIPFLGIPFADIDVIKEAFGCKRQVANVLYGNYIGRSVRIQSQFTIILKPEIFALYQSHTLSDGKSESGDRPSLKLGPVRALLWFGRRHFLQLTIKGCVVYGVIHVIFTMLVDAPGIFSEAVTKNMTKTPTSVSAEPSAVSSPAPVRSSSQSPELAKKKREVDEDEEEDFRNQSGIYVYGQNFIVTKKTGRVEIGEVFEFQGKNVILESVVPVRKKVSVRSVPSVPSEPDGVQFFETSEGEFGGSGVREDTGAGESVRN